MPEVPIEYRATDGSLNVDAVFEDRLSDSELYLSEMILNVSKTQKATQHQRSGSGRLLFGSGARARYFSNKNKLNESMNQSLEDFWNIELTKSISLGDFINNVPKGPIDTIYNPVVLARDGLKLVSTAYNGVKSYEELSEFHLDSMSFVIGALALATFPIGGTVAATSLMASLLYEFAVKDYIRTINQLTP